MILALSGDAFAQTAKKTITNEDLEKFKQKRLQANAEYLAKYKERGMPSPEELERRNQENALWRQEFSQRMQKRKQQAEEYWQPQANVLRREIYGINVHINYLNNLLAKIPRPPQIVVSNREYSEGLIFYYGNNEYFVPYSVYINRVRREQLTSQLQSLGVIRARLLAEWDYLVEEAYRAGVKLN